VAFSETLAAVAADVFRRLGSPRKRAADVAIGVAAAAQDALLLTRSARDFAGIADLRVETAGRG
jgi:predicted nucleic acid-binding protein